MNFNELGNALRGAGKKHRVRGGALGGCGRKRVEGRCSLAGQMSQQDSRERFFRNALLAKLKILHANKILFIVLMFFF